MLAIIARAAAARGRGGRRLPALVDRQPGARAARRRAARRAPAGRPVHALAPSSTRSCASTAARPSTCIDASLKPLMTRLSARAASAAARRRLRRPRADGDLAGRRASTPTASPRRRSTRINSGPAMAPVAGRCLRRAATRRPTSPIVADTGGTSYDVSLVRARAHPVDPRDLARRAASVGHMTGFPSVDVRSIGAGGGSIAWVDAGGLLHVGPQSAGADPGPGLLRPRRHAADRHRRVRSCSATSTRTSSSAARCGSTPTPRDAALEARGRRAARARRSTRPRRRSCGSRPSTWCAAIEEITVNQGIDPRAAVLVGGGGAAGLNAVAIARRLGCPR